MSICPICKGQYGRTYEQHTGSERHRAAVRERNARPDPAPSRRPSANACSAEPHGEKDRLAAIGWYWADGAWHSACVQHATVIPAWQSGDWRGQGSQPTLVR